METQIIKYAFRYTTKRGAHRYASRRKHAINLGDVYLRGVPVPPKTLTITIEG